MHATSPSRKMEHPSVCLLARGHQGREWRAAQMGPPPGSCGLTAGAPSHASALPSLCGPGHQPWLLPQWQALSSLEQEGVGVWGVGASSWGRMCPSPFPCVLLRPSALVARGAVGRPQVSVTARSLLTAGGMWAPPACYNHQLC